MKNIIVVMLISILMGFVSLNSAFGLWAQVSVLVFGTLSLGSIAMWELHKSKKESHDRYVFDQLKTIYYSNEGLFSTHPTKNDELEIKGRLSESEISYAIRKGYIDRNFTINVR